MIDRAAVGDLPGTWSLMLLAGDTGQPVNPLALGYTSAAFQLWTPAVVLADTSGCTVTLTSAGVSIAFPTGSSLLTAAGWWRYRVVCSGPGLRDTSTTGRVQIEN